jgi:hypothetical protein
MLCAVFRRIKEEEMPEREYAVGEVAPEVIVSDCTGDLTVEGWAEARILLESDEEPDVRVDAGKIFITMRDDARLCVPLKARVRIENARSDVRIRDLDSPAIILMCNGDLELRRCTAVDIGDVRGDVKASRISGEFRAKRVSGDVRIRQSTGGVFIETDGDVSIRTPIPEAQVRAHGDVLIALQPKAGSKSFVYSDGGVQCMLQLPASVAVKASAQSAIQIRPPLTASPSEGGAINVTVGAAEAELVLDAKGSIEMGGWMETEYIEEWGRDLGRMGMEFGAAASEWGLWLDGKIRDKMEDVDRAIRKRMSAGDFSRPRSRTGWDANPPRGRGASENERMSVLQMLQEGKINVDEADRLLAALDGRRAG